MAKTILTLAQVFTILRNLGWRIRTEGEGTQCVRHFQRGFALGKALEVDGIVGPKTSAALLRSYANLKAGRGTASEHFSFTEFRCKCSQHGGPYDHCMRIWTYRSLIVGLEAERRREGPLSITSGCRCPDYNATIRFAVRNSQHVQGRAADIHSDRRYRDVAALGVFSGIGYAGSSGHVRHVDVRSSASKANPVTWRYSQW